MDKMFSSFVHNAMERVTDPAKSTRRRQVEGWNSVMDSFDPTQRATPKVQFEIPVILRSACLHNEVLLVKTILEENANITSDISNSKFGTVNRATSFSSVTPNSLRLADNDDNDNDNDDNNNNTDTLLIDFENSNDETKKEHSKALISFDDDIDQDSNDGISFQATTQTSSVTPSVPVVNEAASQIENLIIIDNNNNNNNINGIIEDDHHVSFNLNNNKTELLTEDENNLEKAENTSKNTNESSKKSSKSGVDINELLNVNGLSLLHHCAIFNRVEIASILIQHHAIVDCYDDGGWTPLHYAVGLLRIDMVVLLLNKNADCFKPSLYDRQYATDLVGSLITSPNPNDVKQTREILSAFMIERGSKTLTEHLRNERETFKTMISNMIARAEEEQENNNNNNDNSNNDNNNNNNNNNNNSNNNVISTESSSRVEKEHDVAGNLTTMNHPDYSKEEMEKRSRRFRCMHHMTSDELFYYQMPCSLSDFLIPKGVAEEQNEVYLKKQLEEEEKETEPEKEKKEDEDDQESGCGCESGIPLEEVDRFENRRLLDRILPETGDTLLLQAVSKNYLNEVEMLLAGGANPNATDLHGWAPLHLAAFLRIDPILECLYEYNALSFNLYDGRSIRNILYSGGAVASNARLRRMRLMRCNRDVSPKTLQTGVL